MLWYAMVCYGMLCKFRYANHQKSIGTCMETLRFRLEIQGFPWISHGNTYEIKGTSLDFAGKPTKTDKNSALTNPMLCYVNSATQTTRNPSENVWKSFDFAWKYKDFLGFRMEIHTKSKENR